MKNLISTMMLLCLSVFFVSCSGCQTKQTKIESSSDNFKLPKDFTPNDKLFKAMSVPQNEKELEEDLKKWQEAVSKNPNDPEAYLNLGMAYSSKGMPNEAIEAYKKCLQLKPDHFNASQNLAIQYFNKGAHDEAIQVYKNFIKHSKNSSEIMLAEKAIKGEEQYKVGKQKGLSTREVAAHIFEKEFPVLERSAQNNPNNVSSHYSLGLIYQIQGQIEKAEKEFKAVIALAPQCMEACLSHNALGQIYEATDKPKQAVKEYNSLIKCGGELGNFEKQVALAKEKVKTLSAK